MKIKNSLSILLVGLVSISLIFTSLAMAVTNNTTNIVGVANGFKVSPVIYEITVEKGRTDTEIIYVTNVDVKTAIIAQPIVNDFLPSSDESGTPNILLNPNQSAPSDSFKSIVKSVKSVTIQPGQTAQVPVVISVPKNAESGGYYGAVRFISGEQNKLGGEQNLGLSASVGVLFLVTVPGNLMENLQEVDFSAAKNGSTGRFFINATSLSIITRLRSTGNIHVQPFGTVQVADSHGKIIEEYEFNNRNPRANVLPNSTRKFEDQLKNKKWIGKYTITANLGYGTSGNLLTMKNYFWVIPLWMVIVFVIILLAILAGGYYAYRKINIARRHKIKVRR
jgi:hypothetical protein